MWLGITVSSESPSSAFARNFSLLQIADRQALFWIGTASATIGALLLSVPLYSLQIFDRVLTSRSLDTLFLLTGIVVFTVSSVTVLDAMRARVLIRMANLYVTKIGRFVFDAVLNESSRRAEPNSQPLRDLRSIHQFLATPPGVVIFFDLPFTLVFLLAVFALHPTLGFALLTGIAILIIFTLAGELLTASHFRANNEAEIQAQRFSDSAMANAEVIDAMGMGDAVYAHWLTRRDSALIQFSKAGDRSAIIAATARWIRLLLAVVSTAIGAWLVLKDEMTIGAMVAANILAARSLSPLETVVASWRGFVSARAAHERIDSVLRQCIRSDVGIELPTPQGVLSIERLVYRPPGIDQPTIKGVTLRAPAGSLIGLIGPSGAGKSTLAKLICGVWKPAAGSVRLDGADVYTWPRKDWGLHCGYLPQEVELFAGTVGENIARFRKGRDSEVIAAASAAGIHEWILQLPLGYSTQIGHGGAVLSGGQRQQLALARALFGNPKLIVLDEPNANLDAEGEKALLRTILRIRQTGVTMFVITHRQSLLGAADLLAVMIDGQLRHYGPRADVLLQMKCVSQAKGNRSDQ